MIRSNLSRHPSPSEDDPAHLDPVTRSRRSARHGRLKREHDAAFTNDARRRNNINRIHRTSSAHRCVAFFIVGCFVFVASIRRWNHCLMHSGINPFRCSKQRVKQANCCDGHFHVPALFAWLLVDAFGLGRTTSTTSTSSTTTLSIRPMFTATFTCHTNPVVGWNFNSIVKSSLSSHYDGSLWGRRKQHQQQQQQQRWQDSSSLVVLQSTINGQIAEANFMEGTIQTTSTDNNILSSADNSNARANTFHGSSSSSSSTASHYDPYTSLTPTDVPNRNGEYTNGNPHSHSSSPHADETPIQTAITDNHPSTHNDNDNSTDIPHPTPAGGYTHTAASRAKISAANKGKTPWNKGQSRPDEVRARIAEGVRRRNRERFLTKLQNDGVSEEEYERRKKDKRRKADAERRARRTEAGGYIPTEETKQKISAILKEKYANGEIVRKPRNPSKVRKGFKHSEETKAKIAESLRRKWAEDTEYRDYMTSRTIASENARNAPSVRSRISDTLKKKWEDPEFRQSMMNKFAKRKAQSRTKALEHRQKISEAMKRKWMDEEYRRRATEGMVKGRENAPLKPMKPVQPKGLKKVDPLRAAKKQQIKRKKKLQSGVAKRKTVTEDEAKVDSSPVVALEPISSTAAEAPNETLSEPMTEEDLQDGSIQRLRKERRDLYDLLYGDDEDEVEDNIEDSVVDMDVSFTSLLLNGVSGKSNNKMSATGAMQKDGGSKRPVLVNGDTVANGGVPNLASILANDENLDDYDPYGLENF